MTQKIMDYLKTIGLSQKEASLYRQILMNKQTTVKEVADALRMNRITAHGNIEGLIDKGLVSEIKIGGRRAIVAEPPNRLKYIVEKQADAVYKMEKKLPDIIKNIQEIIPEGSIDKSVQATFYEGRSAVLALYKDMLKSNEVYSFVNLDKYYSFFPGTQELFKKAFDNNPKRKVWVIALDTPLARSVEKDDQEKYTNYYCKYISESEKSSIFEFTNLADYQMYDDKLAIIQTDTDRVYATLIQSKLIYLSFLSLHKYIWKLLA